MGNLSPHLISLSWLNAYVLCNGRKSIRVDSTLPYLDRQSTSAQNTRSRDEDRFCTYGNLCRVFESAARAKGMGRKGGREGGRGREWGDFPGDTHIANKKHVDRAGGGYSHFTAQVFHKLHLFPGP